MNKTRLLLILAVAAILILAVSLYFTSAQTQRKPLTVTQTNPRSKIESEIKATFTASSEKPIITYINLASEEKDPKLRYDYYVRAYSKMLASYNISKDTKEKTVINDFYNYLKTLKEFKAGDLSIPK